MSIFNQVQVSKPPKSTFNLSHTNVLSCKMGKGIPFLALETLPGDKFDIQTGHLLKLAPLVAPLMHSINITFHYFFVPNRIMWESWQDFITAGEDGYEAPTHPYMDIDLNSLSVGCNADYFGLPVDTMSASVTSRINPFPFCAYARIYHDYYRDQNADPQNQDSDVPTLVDGDNSTFWNTIAGLEPWNRAWAHDYFTSSLPWTQRGPEATIPLGTSAPIDFAGVGGATKITDTSGVSYGPTGDLEVNTGVLRDKTNAANLMLDNSAQLSADLSSATAAGIIDLRRAFALQKWLEKNARGGGRYKEVVLMHFAVNTSDGRLQRSEFIGGSTMPINISEVLQTSSTASEPTPQGNQAGHGMSVGQTGKNSWYCEEHGWIIGIFSIMPKAAYMQGINRKWSRFDKLDYAWPVFAHIGEQEITNKELYVSASSATNDGTFGYVPRYAEYKYHPNTIHGEMRTSLDFWHMARIFSSTPAWGSTFIECEPRTDIFAVAATEQCYIHLYNQIYAKRPLPYFGNPKL